MRLLLRLVAGLLLAVLVFYVGAVGYLYLFQRSFVFHPGGLLAEPAEKGLSGVEVVTIPAGEVSLTGWYSPASQGRPTLLYFHGNAGNLSGRADRFAEVVRSGFGLLAISYRGFPGSSGTPSEAGFYADGVAAFDWLRERTPEIVLHGESLGTGVATYVASQRDARALILEAPFTATVDIAAATYPWVPVGVLMIDQFRSREHIRDVREPVLILHGTADTVIPVQHGRDLFALAGEPKELVILQGARHDNLWASGLWSRVLAFLQAQGVTG